MKIWVQKSEFQNLGPKIWVPKSESKNLCPKSESKNLSKKSGCKNLSPKFWGQKSESKILTQGPKTFNHSRHGGPKVNTTFFIILTIFDLKLCCRPKNSIRRAAGEKFWWFWVHASHYCHRICIKLILKTKIEDDSRNRSKNFDIFQLFIFKNCHFSPFLGHFMFTFLEKIGQIPFWYSVGIQCSS